MYYRCISNTIIGPDNPTSEAYGQTKSEAMAGRQNYAGAQTVSGVSVSCANASGMNMSCVSVSGMRWRSVRVR